MKIIKTENKLCSCCMETHDVQTVYIDIQTVFKERQVKFRSEQFYCENAQEYYASEKMMSRNDIALKNAYRKAVGLLTSKEIVHIRKKYGISQTDLCKLLGWGEKTIARYEGHQVQDRAHDSILRKLNDDPEWFLRLLEISKDAVSPDAYTKYKIKAAEIYSENQDNYLKQAIQSKYARYLDNEQANGGSALSLDKVVEVINYYANSKKIKNLYKVKLMKMLWYADSLSYKLRGRTITGLVYMALDMGAVPIGHDIIMELPGVNYEEIEIGDGTAYKFLPQKNPKYTSLSEEDIDILNKVIRRFAKDTKDEIVSYMHQEKAYKETKPGEIISFEYAKYVDLRR